MNQQVEKQKRGEIPYDLRIAIITLRLFMDLKWKDISDRLGVENTAMIRFYQRTVERAENKNDFHSLCVAAVAKRRGPQKGSKQNRKRKSGNEQENALSPGEQATQQHLLPPFVPPSAMRQSAMSTSATATPAPNSDNRPISAALTSGTGVPTPATYGGRSPASVDSPSVREVERALRESSASSMDE